MSLLPNAFERATASLERQPKGTIALECAIAIVAIGAIDNCFPSPLTFQLFYLLPIVLSSWFCNGRVGLALAVLGIIAWECGDVAFMPELSLWLHVCNGVIRLASFGIAIALSCSVRRAYDRERHQAQHDPLTGLLNRRRFTDLLDRELDRARRYGHPLSLAYLDLDNFKTINDCYGHDAGDRLLVEVAAILRHGLRASDAVGRIGGDEFLILFANTDRDRARQACQRLRQDLHRLGNRHVSFSIGLVTALSANIPDSSIALIAAADRLMYRVKTNAKDAIADAIYDTAARD